jgi:hypothetical protein
VLAGEGAALAIVDLNAEGLEALAAETGGHAVPVDLRDGGIVRHRRYPRHRWRAHVPLKRQLETIS